MTVLKGLAPVSSKRAKVLILGSMPGAVSLHQAQYYANPQNAFWPILCSLLGLPDGASYDDRLHAMRAAGIALWDVVYQCKRSGSLDASIEKNSIKINKLNKFLVDHTLLKVVFFNGSAAQNIFKRSVQLSPPMLRRHIEFQRLPSTSPANASWSFVRKKQAWHEALSPWLAECN